MFTKTENSGKRFANKSKQMLGVLNKTLTDLEAHNKKGQKEIVKNEEIIKTKKEENASISKEIESNNNFIINFRNLFTKPEENAN